MSQFCVGPACRGFMGAVRAHNMDTLGIEPRASRMLSGCDTTTPCAPVLLRDGGCCMISAGWVGLCVRVCVCVCVCVFALASGRNVTAVGFEPTPLRTGALSQRLRPLGQTVLPVVCVCVVGFAVC
jgi:hypothetical protein